jgi:type VI secretion system protein ImpB
LSRPRWLSRLELLEMRQRLTQLMSKMEGNDKLEELLGQVLNNTDAAHKLAQQMGIDPGAPPADDAAK